MHAWPCYAVFSTCFSYSYITRPAKSSWAVAELHEARTQSTVIVMVVVIRVQKAMASMRVDYICAWCRVIKHDTRDSNKEMQNALRA